jgi:hypothetical protein
MSITQQVYIRDKVFDALYIYSLRPKSRLAMQVFVNISSKLDFIQKNYVGQPSQVD